MATDLRICAVCDIPKTNIINFLPHFNYLSATDKTRILLNIESSNLIAQEVIGNVIKELYQERRNRTS